MSSILGPAPIADFDGTVARLRVDWSELRSRLGVASIVDVWAGDAAGWEVVRDVEVEAAHRSAAVDAVCAELARTERFAILTNNSEDAVAAFLATRPALAERVALVVGRETLGGPKTDAAIFERGFASCVAATAAWRGSHEVVYVGDADYELALAADLGARAVSVDALSD